MKPRELVLEALRDGLLTCRSHILREGRAHLRQPLVLLLTDPIFKPATVTSKQDAIETLNLAVIQCSAFCKANPVPWGLPIKQLLVTYMPDLAKRNISASELGMRRSVSAGTAHNDAVRAGAASAAALEFLRDAAEREYFGGR
jgi:hypothetical protein